MSQTTQQADAEIIAALDLRAPDQIYITPPGGVRFVMRDSGPDEPGEDYVVFEGKLCLDANGHYLGCIDCGGSLQSEDAGMCELCRKDLAFREEGQ